MNKRKIFTILLSMIIATSIIFITAVSTQSADFFDDYEVYQNQEIRIIDLKKADLVESTTTLLPRARGGDSEILYNRSWVFEDVDDFNWDEPVTEGRRYMGTMLAEVWWAQDETREPEIVELPFTVSFRDIILQTEFSDWENESNFPEVLRFSRQMGYTFGSEMGRPVGNDTAIIQALFPISLFSQTHFFDELFLGNLTEGNFISWEYNTWTDEWTAWVTYSGFLYSETN
ncbi:MAG: hypothetical protein FWD01_02420 [Defluviitaleaceae bacterium]|nr:hypothetical protein [Defluviitaleaceae bacterium]